MPNEAARHLAQAIQYPTISHLDQNQVDWSAYDDFITFLEGAYPKVHSKLNKAIVNQYGLIYHWQGKNPDKRILLTAHYDVVPADPKGWPSPPFSGEIAQGKVYGRGSLDNKSSVIAIMEAVTSLLEAGFVPPHDIYIAFGFDEEVGGTQGAMQMADWFLQQGIVFDYVLDEGGAVADGAMMGINKPVAVIGIAEKGNTSFELTFTAPGGHAAAPPPDTAVSLMGRFMAKVQAAPPAPRITEALRAMLVATAPHKPGTQGFVLAHPGLFAPLIINIMQKNRQTAAMLRTTLAFTMASGGSAHNVLPVSATCTVNLRILPGDSVEAALARLRSLGIPFEAKPLLVNEPTRTSQVTSPGMTHIKACIAAIFPDAVPTPYLMTGGTDCRHYEKVARNCYRFQPVRVNESELALMHSSGEYLSLDNLMAMIAFYKLLIFSLPT